MRMYIALMFVFLLVTGCGYFHRNSMGGKREILLDEKALAELKQRVQRLQVSLRGMSGEDLLNTLAQFSEQGNLEVGSPAVAPPRSVWLARLPEQWTLEEEFFNACKDYFIEKELLKRGAKVKEDLVRHRHDPRMIYTGFSFTISIVGDLCAHDLARLERIDAGKAPDKPWHLYFSFMESGDQLGSLIRDASLAQNPEVKGGRL